MAQLEMTTGSGDQIDNSLWPMTNPSLVRAAGAAAGKEVRPLDELYAIYLAPLRVHLLGRFHSFPPILRNVDDLLQEFALKKVLGDQWLARWDPQHGRFRDFLRTSLNYFVLDWWKTQPEYQRWKKQKVEKGSSGVEMLDVDELFVVELPEDLAAPAPDPGDFNLTWAQTVLAEALNRLERACKDPTRDQPRSSYIWEVFRLRTLDPVFKGAKPASYAELVKTFGLRSPTEGTNMLLGAKRMFKARLEEVITEYAGSDKAAKAELDELAQFVERLAGDKVRDK
jgi:hypothetical protein